jgi:hypothetical protein
MRIFTVKGYHRATGTKQTVTVQASSNKEAKATASAWLTYPRVVSSYPLSKNIPRRGR